MGLEDGGKEVQCPFPRSTSAGETEAEDTTVTYPLGSGRVASVFYQMTETGSTVLIRIENGDSSTSFARITQVLGGDSVLTEKLVILSTSSNVMVHLNSSIQLRPLFFHVHVTLPSITAVRVEGSTSRIRLCSAARVQWVARRSK